MIVAVLIKAAVLAMLSRHDWGTSLGNDQGLVHVHHCADHHRGCGHHLGHAVCSRPFGRKEGYKYQ